MSSKYVLIFTLFILVLSLIFLSCSTIKKQVDIHGIKDMEKQILMETEPCSKEDVQAIFTGKDSYTTFSPCEPSDYSVDGQPRWIIDSAGGKKIRSSLIKIPSPHFGDTALFYFYTPEDWDGKRAVIWVPGFGVNDFAFNFTKKFMHEELQQGYAVLFYNLPYHLDRIPEGKEAKEGLITGNVVKNLENLHALSEELNKGYCYLESIGVERIGAWSASIGSSAIGILAASREFDHISMMIPIVDWNTLIFNSLFEDVREEIMGTNCSEQTLRKAYTLVSPAAYELKTPPERVLIQYAEYDQLTPASIVEGYAEKREIPNINSYRESHATILLNRSMYKDYARFLEKMKKEQVTYYL
jgi:hypothetical protein